MHKPENLSASTRTMLTPDDPSDEPLPVSFGSPLLPWVWTRHLYEPICELSDLGHRSSTPVVGYMKSISEECQLTKSPSSSFSESHDPREMTPPTATRTAEDRLAAILSNQYKRHMCKSRPRWYQGHPLDTAPKCFTPWRRNDVPLIRDWATFHRVTAKKAAWMGKVFSHKYYDVNGVIWTWEDPASALLVDLFASDIMDSVELAISSDPFHAPHIVVTHSPGEEPEYLDTHGNPDQLTSAPSPVPNPWGCTPRQSFTSPTGMDQLLLPPRMSMCYERDEYAELCAAATTDRQNIFLRVSIRFQEGLRKARYQHDREHGRDTGLENISSTRSEQTDLEPMTRDEAEARGFSDTYAAESLMARGIMFQLRADDLALMAESAILSEESEDEDEDGSVLMSPHKADEQSSVSSCFIDEDSFESGSETPDTDEDDC
ncbi:unnamed protein product [Rhizoctonia solani]|uniref:Uncharacterized protein n=1 Tax=Rhizoctonia solani TaxID=456999 RepID=A0A8H3BI44_9AGAM|nr:unnamed protein product [Rhizoctonia solani]